MSTLQALPMPLVLAAALLGAAGCTCGAPAPRAAAPAAAAPAPASPPAASTGLPGLRAGSSAFHRDLAAVHERYGDPAGATAQLARAAEVAQDPADAVAAYVGLARVREAARDAGGAQLALEKALEAARRARPAGAAPTTAPGPVVAPSGAPGVSVAELAQRLARLYGQLGRHQDAEELLGEALREAREPFRRDQILRARVQLYRAAGTLPERLAEWETALTAEAPDEDTLRLLAAAYGGGGPAFAGFVVPQAPGGSAGPASGPATAPAPALDKLTRVYERLLALRPHDHELRRGLLALYEMAQRSDDAVALLRAAPPAAGAGPAARTGGPEKPGDFEAAAACPLGMIPRPPPAPVATAEEVVRLRLRAGQPDDALAETGKLLGPAATPGRGVAPFVVAARLYLEQGRRDLAAKAITAGLRVARTTEDRRELAFAQAELARRSGRPAELRQVYEQWQRSDDVCLRAEATRGQQVLAQMSGGGPRPAMP